MRKPTSDLPVGRLVQLARRRHENDLLHGDARGLWFDRAAADRAVAFFALLRHHKGEWAGQPFILEPWEEFDIIRPIFGWKRADGTRRYRTAYVSVARKNGKSPIAAGVGDYMLTADGEPAAEVYTAATTRDQARIVLNYAGHMVVQSPELRQWIQVYKARDDFHSLSVLRTGSRFMALSADVSTNDGLSVSAAIVDELHAHRKRGMWDVIRTATSARRQPLIFAITTAGFDKQTICYEVHRRAEQVLEGAIEDDSFFAYVATIDPEDDWRDQACWGKANPNLGVSKSLDYMLQEFRVARDTPGYQNTFRRLDLNEWTEQENRAIDMQAWLDCTGRVDEEELRGQPCWGGLDLSSTQDFTACCWVFPQTHEGRPIYKAVWRFWLPAEAIAKRAREAGLPLDVWAKQGWLKLTPGNVVDYDFVRAQVNEDRKKFKPRECAYDPWNATEIAGKLQGDGLKMIECRQGFKTLSEPTKGLLGLILDRRIEHGGHPIIKWMASNLMLNQDPAGNLKPDKAKSSEKIDGMVALIMALSRCMVVGEKKSVYETRGFRTV